MEYENLVQVTYRGQKYLRHQSADVEHRSSTSFNILDESGTKFV